MTLKKGVPFLADRVTDPPCNHPSQSYDTMILHQAYSRFEPKETASPSSPCRPSQGYSGPFHFFPNTEQSISGNKQEHQHAQVHANPQRQHVPRPRKSSQTKRNNRPGTNTRGNTARLALKRRARQETLRIGIPGPFFTHGKTKPSLSPPRERILSLPTP